MSYRQANIYLNDTKAGVLEETESGYRIQYDPLTLTGKKSNFQMNSFNEFGKKIGLSPKQVQNITQKFHNKKNVFLETIEKSFLCDEMKKDYRGIVNRRFELFDHVA